jgi:hypothetical protein
MPGQVSGFRLQAARAPPASGVLALLALLLAAGCARRAPPPDLSLDAAELLGQVLSAQARVHSVQGDARVAVESRGQSGTVSQFLAAERPDRLHVETLDFFGNVAAVLAARDGRFALYDARQKVLYRGRATPENLARIVPLPLRAEELVAILCGGAPLPGTASGAEPSGGRVNLQLAGPEGSATLAVGEGAAVERAEEKPAGRPAYTVTFDGHRSRGGARFPTEVELRSTSPKVKLGLHWKEVEVNGEVEPALFRLEPPAGARVVDLEDGEGPPPPPYHEGPAPP